MANFTLTAQDVGGDPFISGGNINIVNGSFSDLTFIDVDNLLGIAQTGEFVSLDGGATQLSYEFLGYGDVRGDPLQNAGFVRIDLGDGTFLTVAIDMDNDGDGQPNLQNGNTKLKVADLDASTPQPWPVPICFVKGTLIDTSRGAVPIETVKVGDLVQTLDRGLQPVRDVWKATGQGEGLWAPVTFAPGALGNTRALQVSQQHRILVTGWRAELFFGEPEVLVAAKHLVNGDTIRITPCKSVTYMHLTLDAHDCLWTDGVASESHFHRPDATWLPDSPEMALGRDADALDVVHTHVARPELRGFEGALMQA